MLPHKCRQRFPALFFISPEVFQSIVSSWKPAISSSSFWSSRRKISFQKSKLKKPISLDLHGYNSESAKEALLTFISDSVIAGHQQVSIIHGHGSGIIKKLDSDGYRTFIDKTDVVYCAGIYHRTKKVGKQGRRLFNHDGTPYQTKNGSLSK